MGRPGRDSFAPCLQGRLAARAARPAAAADSGPPVPADGPLQPLAQDLRPGSPSARPSECPPPRPSGLITLSDGSMPTDLWQNVRRPLQRRKEFWELAV